MGAALISAARVKGAGHPRCDDRFHIDHRNGWIILALADGAGSKSHASWGARRTVRALCDAAAELLADEGGSCLETKALQQSKAQLVARVHRSLDEEALRLGVSRDALASTLLFAARRDSSPWWVIGHIGDGMVAGLHRDGSASVLSAPRNGEFANETFFVTSDAASDHLRLFRRRAAGIALMSDGTAHTLYDAAANRPAPALATLAKWQREQGSAKGSTILRRNLEAAVAPRTRDDCSLVMIQLPKESK